MTNKTALCVTCLIQLDDDEDVFSMPCCKKSSHLSCLAQILQRKMRQKCCGCDEELSLQTKQDIYARLGNKKKTSFIKNGFNLSKIVPTKRKVEIENNGQPKKKKKMFKLNLDEPKGKTKEESILVKQKIRMKGGSESEHKPPTSPKKRKRVEDSAKLEVAQTRNRRKMTATAIMESGHMLELWVDNGKLQKLVSGVVQNTDVRQFTFHTPTGTYSDPDGSGKILGSRSDFVEALKSLKDATRGVITILTSEINLSKSEITRSSKSQLRAMCERFGLDLDGPRDDLMNNILKHLFGDNSKKGSEEVSLRNRSDEEIRALTQLQIRMMSKKELISVMKSQKLNTVGKKKDLEQRFMKWLKEKRHVDQMHTRLNPTSDPKVVMENAGGSKQFLKSQGHLSKEKSSQKIGKKKNLVSINSSTLSKDDLEKICGHAQGQTRQIVINQLGHKYDLDAKISTKSSSKITSEGRIAPIATADQGKVAEESTQPSRIIAKVKKYDQRRKKYLVSWKGKPSQFDSWESREDIGDSDKFKEFWANHWKPNPNKPKKKRVGMYALARADGGYWRLGKISEEKKKQVTLRMGLGAPDIKLPLKSKDLCLFANNVQPEKISTSCCVHKEESFKCNHCKATWHPSCLQRKFKLRLDTFFTSKGFTCPSCSFPDSF